MIALCSLCLPAMAMYRPSGRREPAAGRARASSALAGAQVVGRGLAATSGLLFFIFQVRPAP